MFFLFIGSFNPWNIFFLLLFFHYYVVFSTFSINSLLCVQIMIRIINLLLYYGPKRGNKLCELVLDFMEIKVSKHQLWKL